MIVITHGIIEAAGLTAFRSEGLHRLEIGQDVDRCCPEMRVGFIHAPALSHAPFGDDDGCDDIDDDREDRDQGQAIIIRHAERNGGEYQPHEGRADIEGEEPDQIVDGTRAAFDYSVQRAGAPRLVKIQGQRLRMAEGVDAGNALRVLADGREQPVPRLRQRRCKKTHPDPDGQPIGRRAKSRGFPAFGDSTVDRMAQQQRRHNFQNRRSQRHQNGNDHDRSPFRQFRPCQKLQDTQDGNTDPAIGALDLVMVCGGGVGIRHRPHMVTK